MIFRMTTGMYILRCSDGSYYVGSSRNVEARAAQHASGAGAAYTRGRLPIELVFMQECESVAEAYGLEKKVQGGRGPNAKRSSAGTSRFCPRSAGAPTAERRLTALVSTRALQALLNQLMRPVSRRP